MCRKQYTAYPKHFNYFNQYNLFYMQIINCKYFIIAENKGQHLK
jgi:hypothetical protein